MTSVFLIDSSDKQLFLTFGLSAAICLVSLSLFDSRDANTLVEQASLAMCAHDVSQAEDLYLKALSKYEKSGKSDAGIVSCLNSLAFIYEISSREHMAMEMRQRALEITWKKCGRLSVDCATALTRMAMSYGQQQNFIEAEKGYRESTAILEKVAPKSLTIAVNCNNLAVMYSAQGNFVVAGSLYEKAIAIDELLDQQELQVSLLRRYSKLLKQTKRSAEAEKIERRISDVLARQSVNH
jgi:tetratricopeptide (TPR) repeat protein